MPLGLRAWDMTRHLPAFRGRTRLAVRLAGGSLDSGIAYRTRHGFALRIDPDDLFQVAMLMGFYEPRVEELVTRMVRPGSVAVDVGHAIGYFSLLMGQKTGPVGQVHAFDPDPRANERLLEHVSCNEMPWISANRVALGDHGGTAEFSLHERIGWSSTKQQIKKFARTTSVAMTTLDAYLEQRQIDPARISLIKVDAEGGELEVVAGMRDTLTAANPPVVIEVLPHRPGERAGEVLEMMGSLGYRPDAQSGDVVFRKAAAAAAPRALRS